MQALKWGLDGSVADQVNLTLPIDGTDEDTDNDAAVVSLAPRTFATKFTQR